MPNIDIGAAMGASFRFVGVAWRHAWGILLIDVWLTATVQAIQVLRPEWAMGAFWIGLLIGAFANAAVVGALYRIGVEQYHGGDPEFRAHPMGLGWGGLEWRVLLANLLIGLVAGGVAFVIGIVWLIIFSVTASGDAANLSALSGSDSSASGQALLHILAGPAGIISLVIIVLSFVGLLYFGARLSLFSLVAADTRAFSFGRAWAATKGATLAIILTIVVVGIVQGLVSLVAAFVAGAVAGVAGQGTAGGALWGGVAASVVSTALSAPLFAGLQLYVFNARRSGDQGIAATFS